MLIAGASLVPLTDEIIWIMKVKLIPIRIVVACESGSLCWNVNIVNKIKNITPVRAICKLNMKFRNILKRLKLKTKSSIKIVLYLVVPFCSEFYQLYLSSFETQHFIDKHKNDSTNCSVLRIYNSIWHKHSKSFNVQFY